MEILLFILALLIVIMVHEAGHFTAAKLLGFKATKFFVGFGPTLWSIQRGETEYGIKGIPAGGFVKIVGMNPYEEVAPEDEPRSYPNKPRWQRAIVIAAGPFVHWPLALLVLLISFTTIGVSTDEPSNQIQSIQSEIEGQPSPAAAGGLEDGDRIVAVDGEETTTWTEVRRFIRENPSEDATFTVERGDQTIDVPVTFGQAIVTSNNQVVDYAPPGEELAAPTSDDEKLVGFLGVTPDAVRERLGFFSAIGESASLVGEYTTASVQGIGDFFGGIFNGEFFDTISEDGRPEGTGIVGVGRVAGESLEIGGWDLFLRYMVGVTIFIGLINLLPLVPLDGGHLMVILWETITRKRVDMRRLIPVAAAVLAFFVILSVVFLYYDIVDPVDVGL